jgi:hypothetical protein
MARRGRCRCGEILTFRRGPNGYKERCPKCKAVVRLRTGKKASQEKRPITCVCGTVLVAGKRLAAVCPTCGRSLAAALGTRPEPENADEKASPALHSSARPSSVPLPSAPAAAFPPLAAPAPAFPLFDQDVDLDPAVTVDRGVAQLETLANSGSNSILEVDQALRPGPRRRTRFWTSYWFWLAVCGLIILLLGLAAVGVIVVLQLTE